MLLADDVYENFESAIDERDEAEETLESTIIGIKSADVIEKREWTARMRWSP